MISWLFSVSSRSLPSSSVAKTASISLDRATRALRERTPRNKIRFCRRVKLGWAVGGAGKAHYTFLRRATPTKPRRA